MKSKLVRVVIMGALIGIAAPLGVLTASSPALAASTWSQGFEQNTAGWYPSSQVVRVPSGYVNGGYASGIASSSGNYHARLQVGPHDSANVGNDGPYTCWGAPVDSNGNCIESAQSFPSEGILTSVDVYLDVSWAASHPDQPNNMNPNPMPNNFSGFCCRFDWDTALNDSSGNFLQDYVFNAGTTPSGYPGGPGFVIQASNNGFRSGASPENPCSPLVPNQCEAPALITTSGWYTFQHRFSDNNGSLQVEMVILDHNGNVVQSWTNPNSHPISQVGGPAYGWFINMEIPDLAIDNSLLTYLYPPTTPGGVQGRATCNVSSTSGQGTTCSATPPPSCAMKPQCTLSIAVNANCQTPGVGRSCGSAGGKIGFMPFAVSFSSGGSNSNGDTVLYGSGTYAGQRANFQFNGSDDDIATAGDTLSLDIMPGSGARFTEITATWSCNPPSPPGCYLEVRSTG
jgi:hypothetical protein